MKSAGKAMSRNPYAMAAKTVGIKLVPGKKPPKRIPKDPDGWKLKPKPKENWVKDRLKETKGSFIPTSREIKRMEEEERGLSKEELSGERGIMPREPIGASFKSEEPFPGYNKLTPEEKKRLRR